MIFLCYTKCTTCQKARKWLDANDIAYEERHIAEQNPSAAELRTWHERSGLPLRRFFNTSGMLYRQLNLKDRIPSMTDEEIYELLSTDGMLVKRPMIITDEKVLVAFRQKEWEDFFL